MSEQMNEKELAVIDEVVEEMMKILSIRAEGECDCQHCLDGRSILEKLKSLKGSEVSEVSGFTCDQAKEAMKAEPMREWTADDGQYLYRWNGEEIQAKDADPDGFSWSRQYMSNSVNLYATDWRPSDGKPYIEPQAEEPADWIECDAKDAEMVRISGKEFEVRTPTLIGANIQFKAHTQWLSYDALSELKATFWRKKPSQVSVTKTFDSLLALDSWIPRSPKDDGLNYLAPCTIELKINQPPVSEVAK